MHRLIVVDLHPLLQQHHHHHHHQRVTDRCLFTFLSLVPLCLLITMPTTTSSFDCLFGVGGPIGSVWLGVTVPTLSPRLLHSLVVTSGLIEEASQNKSTHGHWRTKTQWKSDLTLHYLLEVPNY
jgi:hypothetical protein